MKTQNSAIIKELQDDISKILVSSGWYKSNSISKEEKSARFSPPFEIFDLLVSNVLFNFFIGVASGYISARLDEMITKKKDRDRLIKKEEVNEFISQILEQLEDKKLIIRPDSTEKRFQDSKKVIVDLLKKEGWTSEKAEEDTLKIFQSIPDKLNTYFENKKHTS
ncbi:MAG: hypothetical protein KAT34_05110 [Candidatus Aminicenantes bacterium]|nr:hypothetical protein [Candidatus Aminicenantes bacterium]